MELGQFSKGKSTQLAVHVPEWSSIYHAVTHTHTHTLDCRQHKTLGDNEQLSGTQFVKNVKKESEAAQLWPNSKHKHKDFHWLQLAFGSGLKARPYQNLTKPLKMKLMKLKHLVLGEHLMSFLKSTEVSIIEDTKKDRLSHRSEELKDIEFHRVSPKSFSGWKGPLWESLWLQILILKTTAIFVRIYYRSTNQTRDNVYTMLRDQGDNDIYVLSEHYIRTQSDKQLLDTVTNYLLDCLAVKLTRRKATVELVLVTEMSLLRN